MQGRAGVIAARGGRVRHHGYGSKRGGSPMSSLLPIVLLTAAVAGHAPVSAARQSQTRGVRPAPAQTPVMITASAASGWIEGFVTDDRNQPVRGAPVTAQG